MASPRPLKRSAVVEMAFHHVGVAVKSIDAALAYYADLFGCFPLAPAVDVPGERVRVCFVEVPPGVLIELVEGMGDDSPVADVVERTGAGPYHICYRVADLEAAIRRLRAGGCHRLKVFERPPVASGEAADDRPAVDLPRRFAFLLTPDRQLFELCEAPGEELR